MRLDYTFTPALAGFLFFLFALCPFMNWLNGYGFRLFW